MHPISGDELADFFANLLRVPREVLSTSTHVLELGADSIMLLEARTWIEARHGRRIEIRRFFEDLNTIDAIDAFLATEPPVEGEIAPAPRERPSDAPPAPAGRSEGAAAGFDMMRAQLALVADVIEAQNRTVAALRMCPDAAPLPPPATGEDGPTGERRPEETTIPGLEIAAA